MRKIIAVVLTVLMIIPLGIVVSSAEATNVARGMTYEFTGAYTDPNSGNVLYPDTDNKELTDGVKSETMDDFGYSPVLWVGLNINGANADKANSLNYIVVDLGEKKTNLTQFVVYTEEYKGPGILKPKSIEVFVSDDNSNFTSIGKIEEPVKTLDFPGTDNAADGLYKYVLNGNASGRYVKFLIHHGSNWCFVSEVEVYQDPDAEPAPVQETITIDGKFDDTG
ncbi:MAG TPA: discoidin domain-containing protein, partial [Bacillota bacterium]|nr:discoidin domain-containing protein [Bacillota bacterium]